MCKETELNPHTKKGLIICDNLRDSGLSISYGDLITDFLPPFA